MFTEQEAVSKAVNDYIHGYLEQDAPRLRRAFHADSKLMAVEDGAVDAAATAAWFDRIEKKRGEGGGPLAARHQLLGIDLTDSAAVAKVRLDFGSHVFTDYLSLLKTSDGWRIVNKVYTSDRQG
jgi:hypothetical protein